MCVRNSCWKFWLILVHLNQLFLMTLTVSPYLALVMVVFMCVDRVQSITAAAAGVKEFIESQVVVIDGGNSPLLLPQDVDTLLSTSVQLAALLGQL